MSAEIIRQEVFEDMQLAVIGHEGEEWFKAEDIGKALGLADPRPSVIRIFNRNRDEFEGFYRVVSLTTWLKTGGQRPYRSTTFNPQGAYLLAILARTEKSKALRRWLAKFMAHDLNRLKEHVGELETRHQADQKELSHLQGKLGGLTKGLNAARKLAAKPQKALPAPKDPNYVKVHRRDLYELKRWVGVRFPAATVIATRIIEAMQEERRPDPAIAHRPEPHASLLTEDSYDRSHVWRLLQAMGSDPEVQAAQREVQYTALFVSRLQHLFESIHADMVTYSGMIRELPMYMDTDLRR